MRKDLKLVMYTLRCTKPLLERFRRLGWRDSPEVAATTALGDWYVNRLNVGKHRLVLCTSAPSLLSVIVPAKDLEALPSRLASSLAYLLRRLGVAPRCIEQELQEMTTIRVAATASRSVLGTMNDFAFSADWYLRSEPGPVAYLSDLDWRLSETPCKPIGYASPAMKAVELLRGAT